jgi:hypothetical protein
MKRKYKIISTEWWGYKAKAPNGREIGLIASGNYFPAHYGEGRHDAYHVVPLVYCEENKFPVRREICFTCDVENSEGDPNG